jgi:hypothetical protein
MVSRNTGTNPFDADGNNRTATHLSTNIVIIVDGNPIGAIQKLDISEERPNIKMIDEVGTDGHIDSAPNGSTNYTINCDRIRFDRLRVAEAFSRGFLHVKAQRIPFDIEIHDRFADADAGNAIITTIKNVWIKKIGYSYQSNEWTITDNMSCEAEDIFSVINSNNVAQANANGRIHQITLNPFEQEADRGGSRGALDAAGLLNAFSVENG